VCEKNPSAKQEVTFATPLVGTQYWRAPTPSEAEWQRDLDQVAALGLEAVQLRVQWAWHERREGEYRFDDVTRLMDLAGGRGLRTIIKFMLEDAPYWLYEDYDAARVAPDGQVLTPIPKSAFYSGLSLPCFDRPIVRRKAEGFIRRLTEITSGHPSLILYSLWNEIRSRPYGQCACADSRRCFHRWLQDRYTSVERLNRALGKDFGDWAHFHPPASMNDVTSALVWRTWAQESLIEMLEWVKSIIRQVDDRTPVAVHAGMSNMINDAVGDSVCDRLNAEVVDVYGHSGVFWDGKFTSYSRIEGKATRENPHWRSHQYVLSLQDNWVRNVAGGCLPANYELYSNDYGGTSNDFGPEEMDDFVLTSLSEGIKLVLFWQFKAERIGIEAENCGLIELDGSSTARSERVARLARFVATHRDLLRDYVPQRGEVAIVYDNTCDMISKLQEHAEVEGAAGDQYRYKNNLKGWYRLFWDANVPVDVLAVEDVSELSAYRIAVLPAMMYVRPELRSAALAFVEAGGKLIVDCGFDSRQANGWAKIDVPGDEFAKLLGIRTARKQLVGAHGRLDSPFGSLPVGQFVTRLPGADGPWDSRQTDGAMYFAFNPGEARFLHPTDDFSPFYAWLRAWGVLERRWRALRVRRGQSGDKLVWFVHNLGESAAEAPLPKASNLLDGNTTIAPDNWGVLVR